MQDRIDSLERKVKEGDADALAPLIDARLSRSANQSIYHLLPPIVQHAGRNATGKHKQVIRKILDDYRLLELRDYGQGGASTVETVLDDGFIIPPANVGLFFALMNGLSLGFPQDGRITPRILVQDSYYRLNNDLYVNGHTKPSIHVRPEGAMYPYLCLAELLFGSLARPDVRMAGGSLDHDEFPDVGNLEIALNVTGTFSAHPCQYTDELFIYGIRPFTATVLAMPR